MQTTSGLYILVQLMNGVTGLVFLYCLFSIPIQLIRRFRRKWQGKVISPLSLIFIKLMKCWIISAVIIIPLSMTINFISLKGVGLSGDKIAMVLYTSFIGNLGTSFLFGYIFMKANKNSLSYSIKDQQTIDDNQTES